MNNFRSTVITFIFAISGYVHNAVASPIAEPIRAELITSADGMAPGGELWVGVLLHISDGWHAYWKYPGDAGLPTRVKITAPKEFSVGELKWPTPKKFTQSSNLVGYGYEKEVLLAAPLTGIAIHPTESFDLEVKTDWLACSSTLCVPGKAVFPLKLKVSPAPSPLKTELFTTWKTSLPEVAADNHSGVSVHSEGALKGDAGTYTISLSWSKGAPNAVEWIPAIPKGVKILGISSLHGNDTISATVDLAVETGKNFAGQEFEMVAAFHANDGRYRGITFPVRF